MTESSPWTDLAETWRDLGAGAGSPDSIRAAVHRQTRWMRVRHWAEWLLTVAVLTWFVRTLPSLPERERPWWIAGAALHVIVVVGFAAWNRRGVWEPLGRTTRDYLALAQLRLQRALRTASFVVALIAIEAAGLALWSIEGRGASRATGFTIGAAVVVAATLAIAAWYRARVRRELARLVAAGRQFDPESDGR